MEVWMIILLVIVIILIFIGLWFLLKPKYPQKCQMEVSRLDRFKDVYKEYYHNLVKYAEDNSLDNRKAVIKSVDQLSEMVCPNKSDELKSAYMKTVTIMTSSIHDPKTPEAEAKRGEILAAAVDIAKIYSSCVKVDKKQLMDYFCFLNLLQLMRVSTKEVATQERTEGYILDLIDKINFS